MTDVLRDEDLAAHFLRLHTGIVTTERVERWLGQVDLSHRNAVTITAAIDWIRAETKPAPVRQPITSPEAVAWQQNQIDGYGDAPEVQQQLASFVAGIE